MNKIRLMDGVIDFSGSEIVCKTFADGATVDQLSGDALPYEVQEIIDAEKPDAFMKFMEGNFPNNDTLQTALYFLSLIPAMETDIKYCGVFYGGYATGKTATVEIMRKVLPGYIENIPGECIFRRNLAQSYFPDIKGKGAGVVTEVMHNKPIYTPLVKTITGGDTITTRALYQTPKTYVPTAQLIICTNKVIDFGKNDEAMDARLLVIPFLQKHERGHPQTKTFSEIFSKLQGEFPGIIRMLIEYYIRLRDTHKGVIPQSDECLKHKKRFIKMTEEIFLRCDVCGSFIPKDGGFIEKGRCCPYCGGVIAKAGAELADEAMRNDPPEGE